MNKSFYFGKAALLSCILILMIGCKLFNFGQKEDNDSGHDNRATVANVTVTAAGSATSIVDTLQFTATVEGTNNPPQTVTWSIDEPYTQGTQISPSGLLTAAAGETNTSLTIKATSTADPEKSGEKTVTVSKYIATTFAGT